jgi:hypothetical protein
MLQSDEHLRSEFIRQPDINRQLVILDSISASRNWRPVVRTSDQLRLHPAMKELGWPGVIDELNTSARLKGQPVPEAILITTTGTILAGFGRWRLAMLEGRTDINCIEYPLGDDEALRFIISHHQPLRGWNAFVRIRLALTLEPSLEQKALENMRAGGKYKGWANLPEADHIDVRQEIANFAGPGACARNVSNVKTILQTAHPRLIDALTDGKLRINRVVPWCKLPKAQQVEQLTNYLWERATRKVIRQSIGPTQEGRK